MSAKRRRIVITIIQIKTKIENNNHKGKQKECRQNRNSLYQNILRQLHPFFRSGAWGWGKR